MYHQDTKWGRLQGTILRLKVNIRPCSRCSYSKRSKMHRKTRATLHRHSAQNLQQTAQEANQQTASTTASPQGPSVINTCQVV